MNSIPFHWKDYLNFFISYIQALWLLNNINMAIISGVMDYDGIGSQSLKKKCFTADFK